MKLQMKLSLFIFATTLIFAAALPNPIFAWDLSTASYDSKVLLVGSQAINPLGMTFKTDGTKVYIANHSTDYIYQYTMTTPWDVSTGSYDSVSFYVGSQSANVMDVEFNDDGTKMYILDSLNRAIYQYSLSSAWVVSSASYDSVSKGISSDENSPRGIAFKTDGTKMYVSGDSGDEVNQYTLSTPWDLSTASVGTPYSVTQDGSPMDVDFKDDGTKMYIMGYGSDTVYQYSLSSAWDLTTASYDGVSAYVGSQEVTPWDVHIGNNGSKMYIIGNSYDRVFQYTLTPDTTDPLVSYLNPTDNATSVGVDAVFEIAFNEAIATSTGNIVLYKTNDDSTVETIDIAGALVTASSTSALIINPSVTLTDLTEYYFTFPATGVDDLVGNSYAGITASTTWSFTTGDFTNPTVSTLSPADDATGVALDANLVITFDESVATSTGNITLKKTSDDSTIETFDVASSGLVTGSGTSYTINPTSDLVNGTEYYVQIDATAFDDTSGNSYAGISDSTTWSFTAVSSAVDNSSSSGGGIGTNQKIENKIEKGDIDEANKLILQEINDELDNQKPRLWKISRLIDLYIKANQDLLANTPKQENVNQKDEKLHFPYNLRPGMTDPYVKDLQLFLNNQGYILASTGTGSPGKETEYFGPLTHNALVRFQDAHADEILKPLNLIKGNGYFGLSTRTYINK